jgi:hypothetical protein
MSRMKASDLHGGESGRLVAVAGQDVHRPARVGNSGPSPRSISNVMGFSATRAEAHPPHARVRRWITWFRSGPVRSGSWAWSPARARWSGYTHRSRCPGVSGH